MADQVNTSGSGNTGLGVIVGVILVAVLVLGYFVFGGSINTDGGKDVDVKIEVPGTGGGNTGSGGSTGGTPQGGQGQ